MSNGSGGYSSDVFNAMIEGDRNVDITKDSSGSINNFDQYRKRDVGPQKHGGVDLNYAGLGQNGANLTNPDVYSPVDGIVFYGAAGEGKWGEIRIRDADNNIHVIMHLDSRTVMAGPILAGQKIGTMGGVGPNGRVCN
jgi:murein DD-endopeptidase MepM/ murein hydrolase activator NlpD